MVVAQRGGIFGSHDYSAYHQPKQNRVLRYQRDLDGNWIQEPDEYAIGFPVDHRNASGGVGLACDGTLWSTGDALRNDPALAGQLAAGGPLVVNGLQGNAKSLVRPFNVPPWSSWFIDYKGQPAGETDTGHVGDVEVYRKCSGGRAESYPGWYPVPEWYPPEGWVPPVWWPRTPDLEIEKFADKCVEDPAAVGSLLCSYTIVTTNVGAADFIGQLQVTDNPPATAVFVPPAGGSVPWTCAQPGGVGTPIDCVSDNVETLHPGESETLDITIQVTPAATDETIKNCAILVGDDPNDFGFNEDCDEAELPGPDLETRKHFWGCQPEGANQRCFFILEFENVGAAPYTGALHFVEDIPAGTLFGAIELSTTPGWGCVGGPPVECTLPDPPGITMNPGDVEQLLISIIVPAAVHGDMENCVELGEPAHAEDPEAPGVNKACAPFTIAAPFEPKCPAGWQKVPPGGAPAGWQMIAVHGIAPDGTGWAIMCMRPEPAEELPLGNPGPQPPKPPACKPGETKFNLPHQIPEGWEKRMVTNGVVFIWCAKPPIVQPQPKCKPGETKFINPNQVPNGWKVRTVFAGNKIFYCAKPGVIIPMPKCKPHEKKFLKPQNVPNGWTKRKVAIGPFKFWCATPGLTQPLPTCGHGETKFASSKQVPNGWTKRKVTSGKVTIWCAKPGFTSPLPTCSRGETKFASSKQVPNGWTKRKVTSGKVTIWCAKPGFTSPLPTCRRGETKFASSKQVPNGWTKRKVTSGKVTIWCAKPGFTSPLPTCGRGETKFASSKQVPNGWTKRKVTSGKVTIWCAKPGSIIPPKPKCVGLDDHWIVVHLMIAGRLQWSARPRKPTRNTLAVLRFETGVLSLTEAGSRRRACLHLALGASAWRQFDPQGWRSVQRRWMNYRPSHGNKPTVKRALTDPRIVSGIGNAIRDEILHRARLSPFRQTASLSDEDWGRLFAAVNDVLTEWTARLSAERGDRWPAKVTAFRPQMAVHGRFGQACPDCGSRVQRIRYKRRETNYCPGCQTGGRLLADRSLSRLLHDTWPDYASDPDA